MSEQAPTGNLGAARRFSFPLEYIDVCVEEEGEFSFAVGSVDTKSSAEAYDQNIQHMNEVLGSLLGLYGHDPNQWTSLAAELTQGAHEGLTPKITSGAKIRTRGITELLGRYIHDRTFWSMPMEIGELDGKGEAELELKLTDKYGLVIIGKGVYGRKRFYKEPDEARPAKLTVPDGAFEPVDDPYDPDYLGFLDWHRITFTGRIILCSEDARRQQAA